jgi:hypothetical protein
VNLSSSEASFVDLSRKFGNTSQRQRSLSGHKQIAQATQSTGESLVNTLEKLNECDSKLQWEIFQEQLKYNRQRDLIQQENVRMTHMNQSSLVQAITGLTQVLGVGLSRPPTYPPRLIQLLMSLQYMTLTLSTLNIRVMVLLIMLHMHMGCQPMLISLHLEEKIILLSLLLLVFSTQLILQLLILLEMEMTLI